MSRAPDEGNSLLASVQKGKAALQSAVDEWIESYQQDRSTAMAGLLQFFVSASGCDGKLTPEMRETMDNGRIIRELIDGFDDQSSDYPIVKTGPQWKKFRTNFCELVHFLIRQCQYSIIYDQFLMENMTSFLITFSDSQIRAFRHTATLAAVKLMTALVDVALTLSINIDNTQRQYDKARLEKSKGDKLEVLAAKQQELNENMEDIKMLLGYLFKSIFVHRYRDIVPEIRALCIHEIGIWMKKFPNYFLNDSFLKYVGWTLHDKCGDVRLKCLQSLLPLYEIEEISEKIELFTHKFKDRIIQLAIDKEPEVAVQAIKLIINIHKDHPEVLVDKDCEHIYELVYCTNRSVAQTAGEFLIQKLFQVNEEATVNLCSRRGKKLSVHTPLIKDLVTFFIESEIHEHCAYLVDSLIDSHPMMTDWECMTDLLLEEPSAQEESLGEKQESVLIDLMSCAIKQTTTGEPPFDRIVKKSKMSAKDIATLNEERESISIHFSGVIADLLRKYKTDSSKVINLLEIPLNFVPNTYSQNYDDLEKLLTVLAEVIETHSDSEVLETCARVYELMQNENFANYRLVRVEVSTLLDSLLIKYGDSLVSLCEGSDNEQETISFVSKKIPPMVAVCYQLDIDEIWNLFFTKWIKDFESVDELNHHADETTKNALTTCFHLLTRKLQSIMENEDHNLDLSVEHEKILEFIYRTFIFVESENKTLAEEAYFILCDLFIYFSPSLARDKPPVPALICQPNQSQMGKLMAYVQKNVFVHDEQEQDESEIQDSVEKLFKKRHVLAGFCKLIIYAILPMQYASCVLRHYVTFFNDFGDIMKMTLGKLREMNKVIVAKTMVGTLSQVFEELKMNESSQNSDTFTKLNENFSSLKELAKRFALSFGLDNQKNRDAVTALHREGITFSFDKLDNTFDPIAPPPNLPFLEILCEFSSKIYKQDKKTILSYLEKYVQTAGVDIDEWPPLLAYRNSLANSTEFDISLNRSRRSIIKKRALDEEDNPLFESPIKRPRTRFVSFSVSNIDSSSLI